MRSKSKMYQPVTTFQIRWLTKALLSCSFIFYASQLRQKCTCSLGVQQASAGEHLSLSHVRGFVFLKWILQRSWRPVLEDEILSLQQTSEIKTNIEVLIILCMSWIKNIMGLHEVKTGISPCWTATRFCTDSIRL